MKFSSRARSAFKLIEIDDKYKILKPGDVVLECGAAPGAWTQVCVKRINSTGKGMICIQCTNLVPQL